MGGTVYWMPKFDFPQFLEYNKKYAITAFFTVPPIWLAIAKHPAVTDQFDTLEHAVSGAAPLGKDLQLAASKKLGRGQTMIFQTWGLSETTGSITLLPNGTQDTSGSVACLIANHTARLVDDEGRDVEPGQPGEVLVRGPVVTRGYHKNDEANAESFRDGWFCTGDIAVFRDGKFYIVDRKKVGLDSHSPLFGSCVATFLSFLFFLFFFLPPYSSSLSVSYFPPLQISPVTIIANPSPPHRNSSNTKASKSPPPSSRPCCSPTRPSLTPPSSAWRPKAPRFPAPTSSPHRAAAKETRKPRPFRPSRSRTTSRRTCPTTSACGAASPSSRPSRRARPARFCARI